MHECPQRQAFDQVRRQRMLLHHALLVPPRLHEVVRHQRDVCDTRVVFTCGFRALACFENGEVMVVAVEAEKERLPGDLAAEPHSQYIAVEALRDFQVAHPDGNVTGPLNRHFADPPASALPSMKPLIRSSTIINSRNHDANPIAKLPLHRNLR